MTKFTFGDFVILFIAKIPPRIDVHINLSRDRRCRHWPGLA
ncbi:hypothetical protein IFVP203_C230049 [Vibrio parahaemolyticus]